MQHAGHQKHAHMSHYARLAAMTALSFIAMYILMYAMADTIGDVFNNINQLYMAGLMTAPMVLIEMLVMGKMYENRTANIAIMIVAALALVAFFGSIRAQAAVGDVQFLRSMIPHHSGAILMCRRANLQDEEIRKLCTTIIDGQRSEIDQMNAILARLGR